jgi:ATP-binding cassette subfamily B protein
MKNIFKYIGKYWNEHKARIIILVSFSIISTFILVYWPIILKNIIDSIVTNLESKNITKNLIIFVGLSVGFVIFYTSIQLNRIFINRSFFYKMTLDLIIFLLKQSKKFFNKFKVGDIVTRIIDDISKISWFSCSGIFRFFDSFSVIIFSMLVMFTLSIKITLIVFIPIFLIFLVVLLLERKIDKAFSELQKSISDVNSNIEKAFSSIKIIKGSNMEDFSIKEFENLMKKRKKRELNIIFLDALWHGSNMLFVNFGYFLVVLIAGKSIILDKITLGSFIAFMQYFGIIVDYFYSIIYFFVELKRNEISSKRVLELYDNETILKYDKIYYQNSEKLKEIDDIKKIELKDICIDFGDRKLFENFNLEINKGDFIGLTGKIGTGKSILCDLIIGNEEPSKGQILVNNIPLEEINIKEYRKNFGYVFQEPFLFSGTIKENIVFNYEERIDFKSWKNILINFYQDYKNRKFFDFFKKVDLDIQTNDEEELDLEDKNNNIEEITEIKEINKIKEIEEKTNKILNNNKNDIIINNMENLYESIKFANLEDDIQMFPLGLDTQVGTKGIMVSGGQRERITIARAIYKKPSIYIFDDSTRSLDSKTEKKIIENIKKISRENTIIMVTHRIESLKDADKIIKLT